MKIRIQPISPVQNRDFGKSKELVKGQARFRLASVRVIPIDEAETMTLAELTARPDEATIEILWHDDETIARYAKWVREHPDHELVQ
jgi:hypothetical protein